MRKEALPFLPLFKGTEEHLRGIPKGTDPDGGARLKYTQTFENFTNNIRSRVLKSKPAEFLHCRICGFVLQYVKQTSTQTQMT